MQRRPLKRIERNFYPTGVQNSKHVFIFHAPAIFSFHFFDYFKHLDTLKAAHFFTLDLVHAENRIRIAEDK